LANARNGFKKSLKDSDKLASKKALKKKWMSKKSAYSKLKKSFEQAKQIKKEALGTLSKQVKKRKAIKKLSRKITNYLQAEPEAKPATSQGTSQAKAPVIVKIESSQSVSSIMVDPKKISQKEREIGKEIATVGDRMKKFDADVDQLEKVINEKSTAPKRDKSECVCSRNDCKCKAEGQPRVLLSKVLSRQLIRSAFANTKNEKLKFNVYI